MKRINQLDGLRFIFCCVIIFSHFEFLEKSTTFSTMYIRMKNPTLAVDYFFMLSGFGIYLSGKSEQHDLSISNSIKYAIRKIKKIYPTYIISLLLGMSYLVVTLGNGDILKRFIGYSVLLGIDSTLMQSLSGNTNISHSINGVSWFLSCLFISYMFCPLFLKLVKRIKSNIAAIGCIGGVITVILTLSQIAIVIEQNISGRIFDDLWYGHPIIRCWYLLLGMLAGYMHSCFKSKTNNHFSWSLIIISVIYYFVRGLLSIDMLWIRLFDIAICFGLLLSVSLNNGSISKILGNKTMVSLGNDSMYFYLIHYPVRISIDVIFAKSLQNHINDVYYFIEIILIIGTTWLITLYLKKKKEKIDKLFANIEERLWRI